MARESLSYVLGGINNQMTDEFNTNNDMEVTGGGHGWTATTTLEEDDTEVSAKGTSKLAAAEALLEAVRAIRAEEDADVEGDGEEFENCRLECQTSESDICQCSCGGENHGAMLNAGRRRATVLGTKECLCGCGLTTARRFVPGHDARYHARIKLATAALAAGITVEALVARNKEWAKAEAARKRREKRDARKALAAKAAEVAATIS